MDFEDHAVIHHNLLISVQDLKYPAEHRAVVNPSRAEAAFTWEGTQQQNRLNVKVVALCALGYLTLEDMNVKFKKQIDDV